MDITSDGGVELFSPTFGPTTSVVAEYHVRVNDGDKTGGVSAALLQDTPDGPADYALVFGDGISGSAPGKFCIYRGGHGYIDTNVGPYAMNTWYRVRRTVDLTLNQGEFEIQALNESTGQAVGAPIVYELGPEPTMTSVNGFILWTGYNHYADAYADEVTIASPIPEPSTLIIWSLLGALGTGVGWWRKRRGA